MGVISSPHSEWPWCHRPVLVSLWPLKYSADAGSRSCLRTASSRLGLLAPSCATVPCGQGDQRQAKFMPNRAVRLHSSGLPVAGLKLSLTDAPK